MLIPHVVDGVIGEVEFNMMRKQHEHSESNGFIVRAVAASSSNSNKSTNRPSSDGSSRFTHVLLLLDDTAAITHKRMKPNTTHHNPLDHMEKTSHTTIHISHTIVLSLFQLLVTVLNMLSSVRSV
jgi:hypothetical protein